MNDVTSVILSLSVGLRLPVLLTFNGSICRDRFLDDFVRRNRRIFLLVVRLFLLNRANSASLPRSFFRFFLDLRLAFGWRFILFLVVIHNARAKDAARFGRSGLFTLDG